MAGFNASALAGAFQGYDQYQKDKQQRELQAIDLMTRQQQLRLEQQKADATAAATLRSQKADENASAVLQGFYGGAQGGTAGAVPPQAQGQQMPPPQAPQPQQTAPGQPSVPMVQPGQQPPPIPPGGPQGQMPASGTPPLPPGQPGQPAGQPQAQQRPPAPPPPYQRIGSQPQPGAGAPPQAAPAAPQGQPPAAPAQIPAQPPAENSLSFKGAVQMLQAKGVQGPALVDALDRIKPYLDEQAKQEATALKSQLAIQKAALDVQKAMQQGDHYKALEANGQARIALESQRVALEANAKAEAAGRGAQELALRKEALENSKIPTGYERGADGKLKPMEGGPFDPNNPNNKLKNNKTGTIADRMNPTMLASVKLDIAEGRNALESVKKLTTDTAGPYFAHDQASPLATITGRALTTDQQQQYETYMNRMAVAIASAQSMGRGQISDAKVNEARKLVPQLGDKPGNRAVKIQQIQKIFDLAEKTLNSPSAGNPAEPDGDRAAATAGSVPGGGNGLPAGWTVKVR